MEKKFEITSIKSTSQHVSTEIKSIEGGSRYKLLAILQTPRTNITIRESIPIYINGNDEPAIEIPLYARVVGS